MALLAIVGGLLLSLALILRELHLSRERAQHARAEKALRAALKVTHDGLQRVNDDLRALAATLSEKHLIDDADLARARVRFVDLPRRVAEERDHILRTTQASPTQLVVDDHIHKVH